ncbi:MAG: hypothetical protein D3908_12185 [Candidatus Electrothrix sp. AUS4]|nr:hypothetical protein [Candidatus Electrothrix sp. AUS4]
MKEKQHSSELHSALDPGYLMLAVYVLGVSFLVLFAWLGGNNTTLERNHQSKDKVVTHELMTEQTVVANHFTTDKG